MKQCYHNDLSKECAILSDSEHANVFTEFDATSSFKKLLVKPKVLKPLKKESEMRMFIKLKECCM